MAGKRVATLSTKGQVTLPITIRQHLGLKTGDKVAFAMAAEGAVVLRAARFPTVASLRGAAGSLPHAMPWSAMRQIAQEDRQQQRRGQGR